MTAATKQQEVGHKLDDLYVGFQLIRWLPQEFQSTVQQIYRWKEDFTAVQIEVELILEANCLQLMKHDLEKAEDDYLSSSISRKNSRTVPGGANTVPSGTASTPGDTGGKAECQKKGGKEFSYLTEGQQEANVVEACIPNCYKQAIRSREAPKWCDAMDREMMERKVWDLVDRPDNAKILGNRWVYNINRDENKIVRHKARLVEQHTIKRRVI
ncbi:hypothetical protein HNY73_010122 [Argiope bruennichi]|uniref:Reverse transcriptase Ty1/copia-type domain-containing protein n=1 Tax=Argiope bruennichi TaxID=94029 RepID=A0A8T0EZZ3_ARGBR|nr:hypothetical protein HNY73_010122 [Argiope bruennichi]